MSRPASCGSSRYAQVQQPASEEEDSEGDQDEEEVGGQEDEGDDDDDEGADGGRGGRYSMRDRTRKEARYSPPKEEQRERLRCSADMCPRRRLFTASDSTFSYHAPSSPTGIKLSLFPNILESLRIRILHCQRSNTIERLVIALPFPIT